MDKLEGNSQSQAIPSSEKLEWVPIFRGVIFVVLGVGVIRLLYPWDIIWEAWASTQERIIPVMEFIIEFGVIVFLLDKLKKKKFKCFEWLQPYLDLPCFSSEEKRWIASFLILFSINLFVVLPHRIYKMDLKQSGDFEQQTNSLSSQVALLQEELENWRQGIGGKDTNIFDTLDCNRYRTFGFQALKLGRYPSAVSFFELAYKSPPPNGVINWQQVYSEPSYFFAVLHTNDLSHMPVDKKAVAYGIFEDSLRQMTNRMHDAVFGKYRNNAYNFQRGLHYNRKQLEDVLNWSPEDRTYISNVVVAIGSLETNATVKDLDPSEQ